MPKQMPSFENLGNGKKKRGESEEKPADFKTMVVDMPKGYEDNYELSPELPTSSEDEGPVFANSPEIGGTQELSASVLDQPASEAERQAKLAAIRRKFEEDDNEFDRISSESSYNPESAGFKLLSESGIDMSEFFDDEPEMLDPAEALEILEREMANLRLNRDMSKRWKQLSPQEKAQAALEIANLNKPKRITQDAAQNEVDPRAVTGDPIPYSRPPEGFDSADPEAYLNSDSAYLTESVDYIPGGMPDIPDESLTLSKADALQGLKDAGIRAANEQERIELENEYVMQHAMKLGLPRALARRLVPNDGTSGRRYMLLGELGRGGMGVVYEAINLVNPGTVENPESGLPTDVIKFAFAQPGREAALERFKQEAIVGANLNLKDKGIVGIRDADFTQPEGYLMIQEKAEGNTLDSEVKQKPLTPEKAVDFALSLATALQTLHKAGLVHRDIKPENIFIHRETLVDPVTKEERIKETIKLGDLGLVTFEDENFVVENIDGEIAAEDLGLTSEGATVGTPMTMAPEQAVGRQLSAKSDTYALGETLFFLLTQRFANRGRNLHDVLRKAVSGESDQMLDVVKQEVSSIPTEIAALIDWMKEVDPDNRPTDEELIEALENIKAGNTPAKKISDRISKKGMRLTRLSDRIQSQPKTKKKGFFARLFGG